MPSPLKPREQGDLGELSAMEWLASQGATVAIPVFHSPDWDLVAELDDRLIRVQVKTSTAWRRGRWTVLISTRGGNQSWSGLVKYFDPDRSDFLFAHVGDGRRWFIPATALECRSGLTLGGRKYSEFEVERGRPLVQASRGVLLESEAPEGEYASGQSTAPVKRWAQPSQVRILPPPSLIQPRDRGKPEAPVGAHASGRTTVYPKRRITIPRLAFTAAWLKIGDRLRVQAAGPGRLTVERIDGRVDPAGDDSAESSDAA